MVSFTVKLNSRAEPSTLWNRLLEKGHYVFGLHVFVLFQHKYIAKPSLTTTLPAVWERRYTGSRTWPI